MYELKSTKIETPLGEMTAVAHDDALVFLEFNDNENFEKDLEQIREFFEISAIEEGENLPLKQIRVEIEDYFKHPFASFKTPVQMIGTDFQAQVWREIQNISSGATSSYSEIAEKIDNPNAARAVGNAINANKLAIIVPCHRVLTKNLEFGGYNSGAHRKSWLLQHEGF
ncbi:MAG: methylated-DNA--[protein]-cysteine S-methyltransferase [bacterium]|nr:methylated-DNA--[protein]-cysteine S-methyltransferase [bacterium]